MTLHDTKIGDKGQRYQVGVIDMTIDEFNAAYKPREGEPNPKLDLTDNGPIEWLGWGEDQMSFRDVVAAHPTYKTQLRAVYDREEGWLDIFSPKDDGR